MQTTKKIGFLPWRLCSEEKNKKWKQDEGGEKAKLQQLNSTDSILKRWTDGDIKKSELEVYTGKREKEEGLFQEEIDDVLSGLWVQTVKFKEDFLQ